MSEKKKKGLEAVVREIKRQTRRKFISEEKIRIILEGFCPITGKRLHPNSNADTCNPVLPKVLYFIDF